MFQATRPSPSSTTFEPTDLATTSHGDEPGEVCSTLSPSLLQDLKRFTEGPGATDLLPVVAASVRHGKALSVTLMLHDTQLSLTLHPRRQVYYCDRELCVLPDEVLAQVSLLRLEPDADVESLFGGRRHIGSLRPLLWHLALRGSRAELLPELAGPVRCRVPLGVPLEGLPIDGSVRRLVQRMKSAPLSIDELAGATPLSRAMLQRVWNALYLQSALMVSRGISP